MATTEEIAWNDGSGDKIYVTSDAFGGDQTVSVSSDANTGVARSQVVTFTAGAITQTLTVNQSAGAVTPVFYDYLVFDGTAYIDTSIQIVNGYSFNVLLGGEIVKAAQRVFLMPAGSNKNLGLIYTSSTNSTKRVFGIYYGSANQGQAKYLNWSTTSFDFFLTPLRFGHGNTAYTYTKGTGAPTSPLVLGSTSAHSGQAYSGFMGTFYIYGAEAQNVTRSSGFSAYTPIATLRPCTYNGVAGMWYVEGNTFFGNTAGSGTLTATNTV